MHYIDKGKREQSSDPYLCISLYFTWNIFLIKNIEIMPFYEKLQNLELNLVHTILSNNLNL